jgi:hypothetical protein
MVLFGIGSYCGGLAAGEGMRHVGIPVGNVSDALGMAKGALDAARDRLHLPLFFAFDWPSSPRSRRRLPTCVRGSAAGVGPPLKLLAPDRASGATRPTTEHPAANVAPLVGDFCNKIGT